jgi:hypothetical protein
LTTEQTPPADRAEINRLLDAIALHRRERDPSEPLSARDQKLYAAIGWVIPEVRPSSLEEANAALRRAVAERQARMLGAN